MSSIQSNKDKILEKIDKEIDKVLHQLDKNPDISGYDAVNLAGKQAALSRLKTKISSIDIGTPPETEQFLDTNNKFLNAAYHQAILVKENPQTSEGDTIQLGKEGKDEAIEGIMDYIKSL